MHLILVFRQHNTCIFQYFSAVHSYICLSWCSIKNVLVIINQRHCFLIHVYLNSVYMYVDLLNTQIYNKERLKSFAETHYTGARTHHQKYQTFPKKFLRLKKKSVYLYKLLLCKLTVMVPGPLHHYPLPLGASQNLCYPGTVRLSLGSSHHMPSLSRKESGQQGLNRLVCAHL